MFIIRLLPCLVVALLVACGQPAARSERAISQQYEVLLTLDRLATGQRDALIEVRDQQGQPVVADAVLLAPTMAEMGHSAPELVALAAAPGRYRATGELFPMAGAWTLDVAVRRGALVERVSFHLRVDI